MFILSLGFTETDFVLVFFMRKNLLKLIFLLIFFTTTSYANFIDTKWKVSNVVGETWFSKSENIIGKYQEFYKGFSEGVFYSCDYAGQSATYNIYNLKEFLSNKEFNLFKKFSDELNLIDTKTYVHRITCNGNNNNTRKVFYPFITQEGSNTGYYLFEGAIFVLKY